MEGYNESPLTVEHMEKSSKWFIKRGVDLVLTTLLLLLLWPLLLVLTVWIRMDSPGPALHIAARIGKNGKLFRCYKFRSMYVGADQLLEDYLEDRPEEKKEWEEFAKLRHYDPRVTKAGRWLRKYSLDELPQIFNVLEGTMSLVGPRPYLPREKEAIGDFLPVICRTLPGITGLWQVSGRNEIKFAGRLELDAKYVKNWSLKQDMALLLKTVGAVLGKKGAY